MGNMTIDRLRKRIAELEEDNAKLQAELGEIEHNRSKLKTDIANLEALIANAPNFTAYRMVNDADYKTRDLKAAYRPDTSDTLPTRVTYVSPNFTEITGVSETSNPMSWFAHVHPDDQKLFHEGEKGVINDEILDVKYRAFHPLKNEWRWFHVISKGVPMENGPALIYNGVIIDITDYKRTESSLVAYQERLRAMAEEVQMAEERERKRIAGVLHDSIGQKLFATRWEVERLAGVNVHASSVIAYLDSCIADTRSLTTELYPRELYEFGLVQALRRLVGSFERRYGIDARLSIRGDIGPLEDNASIILYRAISELLTNVAKHAKAKQVRVYLSVDDQTMNISVRDDGAGFETPADQASHGQGIGLFSIKERLRTIGGDMKITNHVQGGAEIVLSVSLPI